MVQETIETRDGFKLAADHVAANGEPRGAVLIAPAMGVPRSFYQPVMNFFAEGGLASLSIDYRGIGGSKVGPLRGFEASLHDWAELDLEAALENLSRKYPGKPIFWVGHSVGGQLLGLMRDPKITAAAFVASQSGYYRNWNGAGQLGMFALWNLIIPVTTALSGKLPMSAIGQGEDVPAGVAREWASWGKNPDYIFSYAKLRPGRAFDTWSGHLRSYAIADDNYAPERSVDALLTFYKNATTEKRVLRPADYNVKAIRHFGPFRQKFRDTFWTELRDYLLTHVRD